WPQGNAGLLHGGNDGLRWHTFDVCVVGQRRKVFQRVLLVPYAEPELSSETMDAVPAKGQRVVGPLAIGSIGCRLHCKPDTRPHAEVAQHRLQGIDDLLAGHCKFAVSLANMSFSVEERLNERPLAFNGRFENSLWYSLARRLTPPFVTPRLEQIVKAIRGNTVRGIRAANRWQSHTHSLCQADNMVKGF